MTQCQLYSYKPPRITTHNPVRIHNSLQTVGNRYQRRVGPKLMPERALDDAIRLVIYTHIISTRQTSSEELTNGRRRLVKQKNFTLAHQRSRKRNDLPLTNRQIRTTTRN